MGPFEVEKGSIDPRDEIILAEITGVGLAEAIVTPLELDIDREALHVVHSEEPCKVWDFDNGSVELLWKRRDDTKQGDWTIVVVKADGKIVVPGETLPEIVIPSKVVPGIVTPATVVPGIVRVTVIHSALVSTDSLKVFSVIT